jgi:hypothetical protein
MSAMVIARSFCLVSAVGFAFIGAVVLATVPEYFGLYGHILLRPDFAPEPRSLELAMHVGLGFVGSAAAMFVAFREMR